MATGGRHFGGRHYASRHFAFTPPPVGALAAAFAAPVVRPVILVKLQFDSGVARVWSGLGTLNWQGEEFLGVGNLGGFAAIEEASDGRATGIKLTLSGVPAAYVSLALQEGYKNRPAQVWLGARDADDVLIGLLDEVFPGNMDTMEIEDSGETATITLSIEHELVELDIPRGGRYTNEEHERVYPGDRGLEFVSGLQDRTVTWSTSPQ